MNAEVGHRLSGHQVIHTVVRDGFTLPNSISVSVKDTPEDWWVIVPSIILAILTFLLFIQALNSSRDASTSAKAAKDAAEAAKASAEASKAQAQEAARTNQLLQEAKDNENHYAISEIDKIVIKLLEKISPQIGARSVRCETLDSYVSSLENAVSDDRIGGKLTAEQRGAISKAISLTQSQAEQVNAASASLDLAKMRIFPRITPEELKMREDNYLKTSIGNTLTILGFAQFITQFSSDSTIQPFLAKIRDSTGNIFQRIINADSGDAILEN